MGTRMGYERQKASTTFVFSRCPRALEKLVGVFPLIATRLAESAPENRGLGVCFSNISPFQLAIDTIWNLENHNKVDPTIKRRPFLLLALGWETEDVV